MMIKLIKNFKRSVSALLIAATLASLLCFSSCSFEKNETAIKLNGVDISNDVYTYFADAAFVELGEEAALESVNARAQQLAATYFKKNSAASSQNIRLTTAEKAAVSEKVSAYWSIYREYYEKIGVSRETLTKVFTADAYRDALIPVFYGVGGSDEVSIGRLYAYFQNNYIVFQVINGYLTEADADGYTVQLEETALEETVLKFQNMAMLINQGDKTMAEAAEFLTTENYETSVQTVVLKKDDKTYPAGFFDKVRATEPRCATVFANNDYIFLVLRGEADWSSDYFSERREEMLREVVGSDIDNKIESLMTVNADVNSGICKGLYLLVQQERSKL